MSVTAPFGGLIIATGLERDPERAQMADEHLDHLIALATLLGVHPLVVVHDTPVRVSEPARGFLMPRAARDEFSSLRLGLMQFANAAVGAAIGGIAGALVGMGMPEYEAKQYEAKVKDGNILISVHSYDSEEVKRIKKIMEDVQAEDISVTSEESVSKSSKSPTKRKFTENA